MASRGGKWGLFALGLLVALGAAVWRVAREAPDVAEARTAATDGGARSAVGTPGPGAQGSPQPSAGQAPAGAVDAGAATGGTAGVSGVEPRPLELTLGDGFAGVRFSGGKTTSTRLVPPEGQKAAARRRLRGRVLDATAAPVVGAAVLMTETARGGVNGFRGDLIGPAGAVSGADGRYELFGVPEEGGAAVAFHGGAWSAVEPVGAGAGDVEQDLRLAAGGVLTGRVTYAGKPEAAAVEFSLPSAVSLSFDLETGSDGEFAVTVPAGAWTVTASRRQELGGGVSRRVSREVQLPAAGSARVELDLPQGVTVAVRARLPPALKVVWVEYWLLDTPTVPSTAAELKAQAAALPAEAVVSQLLGGVHSTYLMEFQDRPAGQVVLCAAERTEEGSSPFACRRVAVLSTPAVQEFELVLAAAAP